MGTSYENITVLILGNGFDLAHKLPTGYKDFLYFCRRLEDMMKFPEGPQGFFYSALEKWELTDTMRREFRDAFQTRKTVDGHVTVNNDVLQKIFGLTVNNIWYLFMKKVLDKNVQRGLNWIDFETEIRNIISFADRTESDITAQYKEFAEKFTDKNYSEGLTVNDWTKIGCFKEYMPSSLSSVMAFRKYIYDDLERFTRALELYLSHFVNGTPCSALDVISKIRPQYVLTFNYTDTFERVYTNGRYKPEIIYIHGKCEEPEHDNNMVLGINEYWQTQDEIMTHVNYAIFKKYVQRIRKHTMNKYPRLINEFAKKGPFIRRNVHVFGHSLDTTDKDILVDFFTHDSADVMIHCHSREAEGELIARMIALIGSDKMMEKISNDTLHFEITES